MCRRCASTKCWMKRTTAISRPKFASAAPAMHITVVEVVRFSIVDVEDVMVPGLAAQLVVQPEGQIEELAPTAAILFRSLVGSGCPDFEAACKERDHLRVIGGRGRRGLTNLFVGMIGNPSNKAARPTARLYRFQVDAQPLQCPANEGPAGHCMSSEHFGQLAWQFKRMSGSSGLKVQA